MAEKGSTVYTEREMSASESLKEELTRRMNPLRSGACPPPRVTPDERKTYFYIKQTQGDTIANQYMDNLNSSLVKRVAEEFADAEAKNPFMAGVEQIRGGLSNWATGMAPIRSKFVR